MPILTIRSVRSRVAPGWLLLGLIPAGFASLAAASEPQRAQTAATPTYTRDVAPILQARCLVCHRRDQVGPFPLETFEQARKRGPDIAQVVEERQMPPWKPVGGFGPRLAHDRSLALAEVAVLKRWLDGGMPEGDRQDLLPPRSFPTDWALGTPDLVLEMPEAFPLQATGPDVYRCFVIPTDLPKDVAIAAVEFRPGNARTVHHAMAFVETAGQARSRDAAEAGLGYTSYAGPGVDIVGDLGGWAAGNDPMPLPDGIGRSLPRRADVILQVHYHPSGKPETDRTRIGLYFARRPIKQTLQWIGVATEKIHLPAGQDRIRVCAKYTVPVDLDVLSVAPHMHQLGREIQVTATHPGGQAHKLIRVADWDPAWQGTYSFETPVRLVRGTIVEVSALFDNSDHPRNPNHPPKLVKYGHEVEDEMCVAYLGVTKVGQDLTQPGQKDDLFAILVDAARKKQLRDQLAATRRRR